jgi:hypothetical protein
MLIFSEDLLNCMCSLFQKPTCIVLQSLVLLCHLHHLSFGVLQLMLPEAPKPYDLLYYPRIRFSNFLQQFRATTPSEQRKLEL